jgi:hypothetical protein
MKLKIKILASSLLFLFLGSTLACNNPPRKRTGTNAAPPVDPKIEAERLAKQKELEEAERREREKQERENQNNGDGSGELGPKNPTGATGPATTPVAKELVAVVELFIYEVGGSGDCLIPKGTKLKLTTAPVASTKGTAQMIIEFEAVPDCSLTKASAPRGGFTGW